MLWQLSFVHGHFFKIFWSFWSVGFWITRKSLRTISSLLIEVSGSWTQITVLWGLIVKTYILKRLFQQLKSSNCLLLLCNRDLNVVNCFDFFGRYELFYIHNSALTFDKRLFIRTRILWFIRCKELRLTIWVAQCCVVEDFNLLLSLLCI